MKLIDSATAARPSQSLSLSIQPIGLNSTDGNQVPGMPVDWKWYLEHFLIHLAGWLLLFTMLFLFAYYTRNITPFVEQ